MLNRTLGPDVVFSRLACAIACLIGLAGTTVAQEPARTVRKVETNSVRDHKLMPLLNYATAGYDSISRNVRDYSCVIAKRERIGGKLGDFEFIAAKIRHDQPQADGTSIPFSVYLRYLKPEDVKDREVLYVEGENNGKLIVRRGGRRFASLTTTLDPHGTLAMRDNRYPITFIGFKQLIKQMIDVVKEDLQYDEVEVSYFKNARVKDQLCTRIRVVHPVKRDHFRFHVAEVFIDDEANVPVRFVSYDWPETPGDAPVLLEEYTYLNVRLNVGFSDADFQRDNPEYGFLHADSPMTAGP